MKKLILLMFVSFSALADGVFTADVSKWSEKAGISGCAMTVSPPESLTITLFNGGTFQEDAVISGITYTKTGTWSNTDLKMSKIRLVYSGNYGDMTGDWGLYVDGVESLVVSGCGPAVLYGPTLKPLKSEMIIKYGESDTAKITLHTEIYGFSYAQGKHVKATHKRVISGEMVW